MNDQTQVRLLSGNEAVAMAAQDAGVLLGTGYPGTPSTEILEHFAKEGGRAQWAPNEKVALEVGLGVAYANCRALVTMKHVGVNVAADPLFTAAYTGVTGGLVVVSADDPGMHSSQNEQDNRRYAVAAGIPMVEPSDSQEAYDYLIGAFELSERFKLPVLYRMTTRVCHSKTIIRTAARSATAGHYERDIPGRVMIPGYARPAHHRLRGKLEAMVNAGDLQDRFLIEHRGDDAELGIITSGISYVHVREAAPNARILKLGLTYPLPIERLREFAGSVTRCVVIEEGDPYLVEALRTAGIAVEGKPEMYRFGEMSVERVRRILTQDTSEEPKPAAGKPPRLCPGCPHRVAFNILSELDCIVAGDIGCYTLGVLPPFEAMDTCVCMGASIGVGLGLRHALPDEAARRVVSVIGDSTFVHSGLTGLAEMAYNPPPTGHVVLILDNGTTAMTGLQEHPGTGKHLDNTPAERLDFEATARALGIERVATVDPMEDKAGLEEAVRTSLASGELAVIIARSPCVLADKKASTQAEACATEAGHDSSS